MSPLSTHFLFQDISKNVLTNIHNIYIYDQSAIFVYFELFGGIVTYKTEENRYELNWHYKY